MEGERDELLLRARDELHAVRGVTASLRNRLKVDTAQLSDCLERMEALNAEIDAALNGSPAPKEGHGHGDKAPHHQQVSMARS